MGQSLQTSLLVAARSIADITRRGYQNIEPNIAAVGVFGIFGFPVYWFVWAYLFPQPYESLELRLLGSLFGLIAALKNRWPASLRPYLRLFWTVGLTYCLPFFFTYMLFRNEFTLVWLMSALASTFLLVLLVDWVSLLAMFAAGSAFGWLAYAVTSDHWSMPDAYFEYLPIFLFALIAGSIFSYNSELIRRERRRAMLAFGNNIVHEIRTPLMSAKAGAIGLTQYLPALTRAYRAAKAAALPVPPIDPGHLDAIETVSRRIGTDIEHVSAIVDMLLAHTGASGVDPARFQLVSMADCVESALARYPFRNERDRAKVVWKRDEDFLFQGDPGLMTQVLLTLLKNAFFGVGRAGKGQVVIRLAAGPRGSSLNVMDTGTGIPPTELGRVFDEQCQYVEPSIAGSGGLLFCRNVAESLAGEMWCRSEFGQYTEFELRLPPVKREVEPVPQSAVA